MSTPDLTGLFMPKNTKKRAAPAPTIRRSYPQPQPQNDERQLPPRKRQCLDIPALPALINHTSPLDIPALPPLIADQPIYVDPLQMQLQQQVKMLQLAAVRLQAQQQQRERTDALLKNLLADTGVRKLVGDCVFERVYK